MGIVNLDQKSKRIQISSFEMDSQSVFNFFDKIPSSERDEKFHKALYIGALALMEDRLSSFLSKTANELGTELESLKIIFDMKRELFYKSSVKGVLAEEDIAEYHSEFISKQKLGDMVELTGDIAGNMNRNTNDEHVCHSNCCRST